MFNRFNAKAGSGHGLAYRRDLTNDHWLWRKVVRTLFPGASQSLKFATGITKFFNIGDWIGDVKFISGEAVSL